MSAVRGARWVTAGLLDQVVIASANAGNTLLALALLDRARAGRTRLAGDPGELPVGTVQGVGEVPQHERAEPDERCRETAGEQRDADGGGQPQHEVRQGQRGRRQPEPVRRDAQVRAETLVDRLGEQPAAPVPGPELGRRNTGGHRAFALSRSGSKSTSTQPYAEMSTAATRRPASAIAVSRPRSK